MVMPTRNMVFRPKTSLNFAYRVRKPKSSTSDEQWQAALDEFCVELTRISEQVGGYYPVSEDEATQGIGD